MTKAIAISMLGVALVANSAAAQTAAEQAQILRDFQVSVVDYTQRDTCLDVFSEAVDAATPARRVFTLPVAMVFRQIIARAVAVADGPAIGGVGASHRAAAMQPLAGTHLVSFPRVLNDALPVLPEPLEYRLIGNDLVIRDTGADVIVAVLRDAVGVVTTRH